MLEYVGCMSCVSLRKWAVLSDRLSETWKAMNRGGQLEKQNLGRSKPFGESPQAQAMTTIR